MRTYEEFKFTKIMSFKQTKLLTRDEISDYIDKDGYVNYSTPWGTIGFPVDAELKHGCGWWNGKFFKTEDGMYRTEMGVSSASIAQIIKPVQ